MRGWWLGVMVVSFAIAAQAQAPKVVKPAGAYRIAGIVYDADSGQTLPGARVSLGSTAGESVPDRSVLTGPDGSFEFDHLPADKYQMYAEAVGYPPQGFEQHEAPYLTGVVVGPQISADHLVFRLQRGSSISGVVTDEFNDPVRQAQVMLFRRGLDNGRFSTHVMSQKQTDDQGHYRFAPLLPGTYFVAVSARPWYARTMVGLPPQLNATVSQQAMESMKRLDVAFPLSFFSGAMGITDATPITLRSGDRQTADIGLHSVPAATLTVTSAEKGHPRFVRLSMAEVGDFDVPVTAEQRGDANGNMVFLGLAPGTYLVHAPTTNGEEQVEEVDISGDTTLDPDTITGTAGYAVKGLVSMGTGAPLPRGLVVVLSPTKGGLGGRGAPVDEKGQFSLEGVPGGTYQVTIANGQEIYLLQMAADNAKVTGRSVTIGGSPEADLALILGKGLGEVRGIALRDGKGLGGTMVVLAPQNSGANYVLFRRDQSDSDGTFLLRQVVPANYNVVAIEDGWDLEWSRPEVLKKYLAKATPVEVAANGKYQIKVQVQAK